MDMDFSSAFTLSLLSKSSQESQSTKQTNLGQKAYLQHPKKIHSHDKNIPGPEI